MRRWTSKMRKGGRAGDIYRHLKSLREHYADICARYPKIPRRVSGYNLDQLLADDKGRFNIARALVGSEGTLVTVLEAKCSSSTPERSVYVLMLGYPTSIEAADHVTDILPFNRPRSKAAITRFTSACRRRAARTRER